MPHRFVPWRRAVLWNQSRVEDAPNAAPDYESGGQEFESLRARQDLVPTHPLILQPLSGMVASPSLRTRAASSPWIAPPQRHVTKFYVEDHAGPAAACRVRCAGVGIAAASLVVTTILGSRTVKVDPRPDSLSTVMSPPIMRAS